jgi:hypothetical protein
VTTIGQFNSRTSEPGSVIAATLRRDFWTTTATLSIGVLATSTGCGCNEEAYGYNCDSFSHYTVTQTSTTPEGVHYEGALDPALLDTYTDEVEACLQRPIDRSQFVVLVAPDWYMEPAACVLPQWGVQELLPVLAPGAGCEAKGYVPSDACPCEWRGGLRCPGPDSQGRTVLVETPSLLILKDNLIRLTLNTSDPWGSAQLSACASP